MGALEHIEPLSSIEALKTYRGRKVFVTGHTGFKGSWLTSVLLRLGAQVTGYSLPSTGEKSHFEELGLSDRISHVEGDLNDADHLNSEIQKQEPDFLFHLAAQALVKLSYADPVDTYRTNVMGSVNVLEAVRNTPSVRSLVFVTSDKCYENKEWIWGYREDDPMGGYDPYSSSKAAAELIFSSYSRSYYQERTAFGAASVRAGNVIGGGDWAKDRIIPDCVRAIEADVPIELRSPTATRPWQHVLEPVAGYLLLGGNLLAAPKQFSGPWNFGPSSAEVRTVKTVAETMVSIFGRGSVSVPESVSHQHEAQLLQLNCDKAHQLLNWRPRWDADETLLQTAQWYKSVGEGAGPSEVTESQLDAFFPELAKL